MRLKDLLDMDLRERDFACACRVMHDTLGPDGIWRSQDGGTFSHEDGGPRCYSSDPVADYAVLCLVRERWDEWLQNLFADCLFAVHLHRRDPSARSDAYGSARRDCLDYEVGDYTLAALLALEKAT